MKAHPLPIYACEAEIVDAIRHHQVVVVEGPAGTGKTTQLPRMLRRAGLVPRRMGITQPRRIAAVSVAWRIAQEEKVNLGEEVGYAIRFDDCTSPQTAIKVMTDGILLQEARGDNELSAYDVLMVDEAHERSLNIDFTLGLLHRVLARRHDLRVVISSATLYPGHFQRFFKSVAGEVPLVSVPSRTYPLDIQYSPLKGGSPEKIVEAVADHVEEIHTTKPHGHILAFLPGEGLIQKVDGVLQGRKLGNNLVVLPLYGRLTREEQERIFEDFGPNRRKVILSTNIAETSVTIEDVHYVIDAGLAKLPWFNPHTGVTTLREEPVSQASATQRAGRAGRTGPGTAIRLYDQQSMEERPKFSPEEILRVDLSEAVLRLIDLGVRDVEKFPFPTPPPPKKLRAALTSLTAMGAIDEERNLTPTGKQMVPFPLSPSLARIVVEAANRFPDAVSDVLLVGAYLSVRSPFTFPPGEEDAARKAQKQFADPLGDAVTAVRACRAWRGAADRPGFCKKNYLDGDTMAFIEKAHAQLCSIAEEHGVPAPNVAGEPEHVVRCLAVGFADKVLIKRGYAYETASELRVALHPSSSLYSRQERFAVATELMSSGRTYAFNVSALKPEWLAEVNPQAARQWQVRSSKRKEREAQPRPEGPTHLDIGNIRLNVEAKRRRPMVDIPLDQIHALRQVNPNTLAPPTRRWRAQVSSPYGVLLRGSLGYVMALLPHVQWPSDERKSPSVPLGALLEADRNLHALQRGLPLVTQPMTGADVPRPGWLALVSNGGGGFWFDVVHDYPEAVYTTLSALDDLAEAGPETTPLSATLKELIQKLAEHAHLLESALMY